MAEKRRSSAALQNMPGITTGEDDLCFVVPQCFAIFAYLGETNPVLCATAGEPTLR
jgi:hypothetical protein